MTKCRRGETGYTIGSSTDRCMIFDEAFASAGQRIKDRITVMLICNMIERIKIKPFIISKCIASRCFREVKNLQIKHVSNTSA
jgi:hypothetical protein